MAGLGVLTVFYATRKTSPELPGPYDYYSATFGDGVLLPICIGCLTLSIGELHSVRLERSVGICSGLAGAALGTLTQPQWLHDDHPRLNWRIPEPHHFNAAGVYHGAYLITLSGIVPAFWSVILLRIGEVGSIPAYQQPSANWLKIASHRIRV